MELLVTVEQRFERTPDGKVWTQSQFAHSFWQRYLQVFSRIHIIARCRDRAKPEGDWARVDDSDVVLHGLPYYVGPLQYLRQSLRVRRAIQEYAVPNHAVILRVGSQIANCLETHLWRQNRPFGVEAVSNPWQIFAPGVVRHPLRPFFRRMFTRQMQRQCRRASAVAYVTQAEMQERYPPGESAYTTHYSSVELPANALVSQPRVFHEQATRLITVGTMAQRYKGFDVLIRAVQRCIEQGRKLQLVIVGEGSERDKLVAQTRDLGCTEHVCFKGSLPAGDAVRTELDKADLFLLPSRSEGLPRAVIEAMARGLPCLASDVGGIPELLDPTDLFPANDVESLADKLMEVSNDVQRLNQMARRNLTKANEYRDCALAERRTAYYHAVRDATQQWLHSTTAALNNG